MAEKEPFSDVKFFCLDTPAFEELTKRIVNYVKDNVNIKDELWIEEPRAKIILGITSKTTLQRLRDTDAITFSQPTLKHIMYKTDSLYEYLNKHANRK